MEKFTIYLPEGTKEYIKEINRENKSMSEWLRLRILFEIKRYEHHKQRLKKRYAIEPELRKKNHSKYLRWKEIHGKN